MIKKRLIQASLVLSFALQPLALSASDEYTKDLHALAVKTCKNLKKVDYAALLPDTDENTKFTVNIYAQQIAKIDPSIIKQSADKMAGVNCDTDTSHTFIGLGHHQITVKGMRSKYNVAMQGSKAVITSLK